MEDEFRIPLERRIATLRGERERIQDDLRDLHHELNSLDRRIEAAEELYRREFGDEPPDTKARLRSRRATRIRRVEAGQPSWRDAVVAVLQRSDRPLHAREIWQRLRESGFETDAADPLRSVVATAIRTDAIRRTGPNTFALNGTETNDDRQLRVDEPAVPLLQGEEQL
jgi:predicted Zn-ribbon and HTH transcriptional regulator